jgi:hypothetical protein
MNLLLFLVLFLVPRAASYRAADKCHRGANSKEVVEKGGVKTSWPFYSRCPSVALGTEAENKFPITGVCLSNGKYQTGIDSRLHVKLSEYIKLIISYPSTSCQPYPTLHP